MPGIKIRKHSVLILAALIGAVISLGCTKDVGGGTDKPTDPGNGPEPEEKRLYNGIVLPDAWPPRRSHIADLENGMSVPYLAKKPDTINIAVGRQLFVDNFLIKETNMERVHHYAEYYHGNPVLAPDKPWEELGSRGSKFAAPFSDGIWYDEGENKFKMWYMGGGRGYSANNTPVTCYAESIDGINWTKPELGLVPSTNIVDKDAERDAAVIWYDKQEQNETSRYKMFLSARDPQDSRWKYVYKTSQDGKLWREQARSKPIADRSTVYKNAFRDNWVYSIRHNIRVNENKLVRARDYYEHADPITGTREAEALHEYFWFGPWPNEKRHPVYSDVEPAIYNMDAIPYESIMLGLFSVWQGPENEEAANDVVPKRNEVMLGYSRDGYHWSRDDMNAFMPVGDNRSDWNAGNIQSVVGSPIIHNDRLYFYVSGRRYTPEGAEITSTGLAFLRRDGFASMRASGEEKELVTESFRFDGEYLFVNAAIQGDFRVEIRDENGNVIPGFGRSDCSPISGDLTQHRIQWSDHTSLSSLEGKLIQIKFYVTNADLYAFWISPNESGESQGYTAGGGAGFNPVGKDI